jgi:hypothetical protein
MVTTLLALPAGCGRDRAPATPRRVTACELLTDEDVRAELGAPVGATEAADDEGADVLAGRSGCAWATADDTRAALVELVRTRDMAGAVRRTGFSAKARFAAARSRHPGGLTVGGTGDDAFWVEEAATLHVLAGDDYLTFEVAVPDPAAAHRVARGLAQRAVRHLADGGRAD